MTNKTAKGLIARRSLLAGLAALPVAATFAPRGAQAMTTQAASALVTRVVDEINGIISSGQSEAGMISAFNGMLTRYADMNIVAQSCLGPAARTISASDFAAYANAFQGYIARKYGKRFREFVGARIEVTGASVVNSWVEVNSTAYLRGESPFEVRFLVSDRSGQGKFFDIVIEGISLRVSERSEIGAMLDRNRGNIAGLVADLNRAG